MTRAVLTPIDIKLLKTVFATKQDLKAFATKQDLKAFATKQDLTGMERRQDAKYATKEDLTSMEDRLKKHVKEAVEEGEANIVRILTQEIKLEPTLQDHERRIKQIEEVTPALPS